MKRTSLPFIAGALLCLATSPAAFAQTVDNSVLYTPNVDLTQGTQNGFVGTVGGIFLTTYSFYPRKRRCPPVIQIEIEQPVAHSELQKQIAVSVCGIFTER